MNSILFVILCLAHLLLFEGEVAAESSTARCGDSKLKDLTKSVLEASPRGSAQEVARLLRLLRYCRRTELVDEQIVISLLPIPNSELRNELYSLTRARHFVPAIPILEQLYNSDDRINVDWRPETLKLLNSLRAACEHPKRIPDSPNCEDERDPSSTPLSQPKTKPVPSLPGSNELGNRLLDRKPVIYLYPTKDQDVTVKLDFEGVLTATYPAYDSATGWRVKAKPDGSLTEFDSHEPYSYLFWEGRPDTPLTIPEGQGFLVRGEDTARFLRERLSAIGLTPKEYNEFIVFWYPLMKENKFNQIYFAGAEYLDSARLEVEPPPDTILRVFMLYSALSAPVDLIPQQLAPTERRGFTLVEWGGAEIPAVSAECMAVPEF